VLGDLKTTCKAFLWLLSGTICGRVAVASPTPTSTRDVWSIDSGPVLDGSYFGETVANGMIGILSAPEPFRTAHILLNGAFEPLKPGGVDVILRTPNFFDIHVSIDGVKIEQVDQVSHYHQTLDMKRALLTTTFDYVDKATITTTVRALRQLPFTALLEVAVTPKRPIELSVNTGITAGFAHEAHGTEDARPPLDELTPITNSIKLDGGVPRTIMINAASATGPLHSVTVAAAQAILLDDAAGSEPEWKMEGGGGLEFRRKLGGSKPYHFCLVGATISSAHVNDPINEAQRLVASAWVQGRAALVANHEGAWSKLWKSDIRIEGDDGTQRDVHSMLYHLYSFVREGSGLSIGPMGLSRDLTGYLGHIFWDAEVWMLPALLALHPELARTMLEYRYHRLPAALQTAAEYGYRGALFPWESAQTGQEETPLCCLPLEVHITADIGIEAWNYYRVTQDREWLRTRGYPLLKETADFWVSRVSRNESGRYSIEHVVAADEYANDVADDAFTNAAARENLAAATAAAAVLSVPPNPQWRTAREHIRILRFPDGVTREHATYHGELIKQADVNLLAYPLTEVSNPVAIRRDLEYYIPRTDIAGGPAMTKSVLAVLYARLGDSDKALDLFKSGYQPNQRPPFGVIAESSDSNNPYFTTGAGGLLQTLLYGWGGLDITDRGLVHKSTKLPASWRALTLINIGPRHREYTSR
jgi:trehalose/maltose hydrolase-like predicted phosphorylase